MANEPIICFGQQPNGFFPKRFLVAKINTARRLQKEIGGKVVWFYHDSDADYRETITVMRDQSSEAEVRLNFLQPNKIQKKFSPLYAKGIAKGWKEEILKQLPRFIVSSIHPPLTPPLKGGETADSLPLVGRAREGVPNLIDTFTSVDENQSVADFCLEMYEKTGLLDGIEIFRSSGKTFREKAKDLQEYFADVEYEGEIVRSQLIDGKLKLHEGGGKYIELPDQSVTKRQKSPGRDQRMQWMQSVINCTHYIYGEGEKKYLEFTDFPEIKFIKRDEIKEPNYAFIPNS